jgi:hypothetical protein
LPCSASTCSAMACVTFSTLVTNPDFRSKTLP